MSDPAIKLFGKTIQLPEPETLTNGGVNTESYDDVIMVEDHQPSSTSCSSEAESKGTIGVANNNNKDQAEETSINKEEDTVSEIEDQSEHQKTLKKPDKILPCPRCNSMDTKFCYYNNYNVNQPRHFCKNCQRYWTAGGTMRNVPVGAGRRKNKTSSSHSHYRQIALPLPGDLNHANGMVLTFMASSLKIADKTVRHKPEKLTINSSNDDNTNNGLSPQVTWPYPSGYPMPFYPAPPYWGCAIPVPWNMQWIPAPPNYHPASLGPISPTLGKHSRAENGEEQMTKEDGHEKSLWAPKTLRIDDPDEAAKSSIWATLGIKNDRVVGGNGGGMFTSSFQSKGEDKKSLKEASPALQANPAALSRSINFQESS